MHAALVAADWYQTAGPAVESGGANRMIVRWAEALGVTMTPDAEDR
jgi:hypothetical protein